MSVAACAMIPAIFFGHGSPMNAIEETEFTKSWVDVVKTFPKPKAILVISAHWETNGLGVTAGEKQEIIYDFYGFPDKLYNVKYEAIGDKNLAKKISKLTGAKLDTSWGLDHGSWSILTHIYPKANIPVLQLSVDKNKTPKEHFEVAKKLAILRKEGVLIIGSGDIVHNLRAIKWGADRSPHDWAVEFSETIKNFIKKRDFTSIINYQNIKNSNLAVPTSEHLIPLIYILGVFKEGDEIDFFAQKIDLGSIDMTSFIVR